MSNSANDDRLLATVSDFGARAEAALLLVESLLHALVDRGGLARQEALDSVQTALDVQIDNIHARGELPGEVARSTFHLRAIKHSLGIDQPPE